MAIENQESYISEPSYGYPEYPPPYIGNESQHIRLGLNLKNPSFLELPNLFEIFAGNSDLKTVRGSIPIKSCTLPFPERVMLVNLMEFRRLF